MQSETLASPKSTQKPSMLLAVCTEHKTPGREAKFNQRSDWWRVIISPPSQVWQHIVFGHHFTSKHELVHRFVFMMLKHRNDTRPWKEVVWLVGPNGKLRLHLALTNTPVLLEADA